MGMGLHRSGGQSTVVEQRLSLPCRHRPFQPVDKLARPARHRRPLGPQRPQVMGDGAGGEDTNPLTAQFGKCLSQLPELVRGEAGRDGDLHQRDLAVRVDQGER